MTSSSFEKWMQSRGLTDVAASEALGCHRHSIRHYREGKTPVPKYIALACAAIAYGLPPIP